MTVTDDERQARAILTHLAEPATKNLVRLVERMGAVDALAAIRSGAPVAGRVSTQADDRHLGSDDEKTLPSHSDGYLHSWRARLPTTLPDLEAWDDQGIRLVCPGDLEWPSQLDDLGDQRPLALWIRGEQNLRFGCLKSVAIVGSRSATAYGRHVAAEMAAELASRNWTVVSGGAFGIDAAAHRGALAADGLTVAVFASGVDFFYPKANSNLFLEMVRDGLVVSEVPPGVPPTRVRFLVRNRVIAALTRGTVVVEAALRSGSISTAGHARELNRAVMAVPGPVTSPISGGCHRLLREWPGTICVRDVEDVLDAVGLIGDDLAPVRRGPTLDRDKFDPTTRNVLDALPPKGAAPTAEIAVKAGLDLDTALSYLGGLAAQGFIQRSDQGWRLCARAKHTA